MDPYHFEPDMDPASEKQIWIHYKKMEFCQMFKNVSLDALAGSWIRMFPDSSDSDPQNRIKNIFTDVYFVCKMCKRHEEIPQGKMYDPNL